MIVLQTRMYISVLCICVLGLGCGVSLLGCVLPCDFCFLQFLICIVLFRILFSSLFVCLFVVVVTVERICLKDEILEADIREAFTGQYFSVGQSVARRHGKETLKLT